MVAVYVDEIKLVEVDSTQTPELFPTSQDGGGEEEVVNEEEELIDEKIFNEEEVTEESEEVIGEENLVLTEYKLISLNLPTVLAANVKEDNPNK
ncbi:MAG: hypothetical protein LBF15_05990 [Candidatus Peribacteria bacterium]|nr:hypothetical protein [Candidatus Peribacteria bacterium]